MLAVVMGISFEVARLMQERAYLLASSMMEGNSSDACARCMCPIESVMRDATGGRSMAGIVGDFREQASIAIARYETSIVAQSACLEW